MASSDHPNPNMKRLQGVHVQMATSLRDADPLLWTGESDPYFVGRIGSLGSSWTEKALRSNNLEFRGLSVLDSAHPEWDAIFTFDLSEDWMHDEGLELTINVYDSDLGKDDYLGSVTAVIPKEGDQDATAFPIVGDEARGNVTIAFFVPEENTAYYQNCVASGVKSGSSSLSNWFNRASNHVEDGFNKFQERMVDLFKPSDEGGPEPSLTYFYNLKMLLKKDYQSYLKGRSDEQFKTADILEPGTQAILSHEDVVEEIESFCSRWVSGAIFRRDGFGPYRMNSTLWQDLSPPQMTLTAPVEQHAIIRPILEKVIGPGGNWSVEEIQSHVANFLDDKINSGAPLRIPEDISICTLMYLKKVLFNTTMTAEEAEIFRETQANFLKIMFLPAVALKIGYIRRSVNLEQVQDFRKKMIEESKVILATQYDDLKSDADLHFVAAALFDAMMLPGSLMVPQGVWNALAVLHSPQSPKQPDLEINQENLPNFVWEVLRFYPLVSAMSYYTGPDQKQRRLAMQTTALRDPRIWGEDADEFKLRDLAQYRQLATILWQDKMLDKENPANNKACPGMDLSYQMMIIILTAFLDRKDNFTVDENLVKMSPQINMNGKALIQSRWQFQTQKS